MLTDVAAKTALHTVVVVAWEFYLNRAFERRFGLADHIKVTGADLKDGLLSIELTREIPEAMKPRKIDIGGSKAHTIDAQPSKDDKQATRRVSKQLENA